ncbi:MAG: VWA domain-containing protein [Spirochaetales bacterium]|nr:VWA domain-containing protein [Spirochaetales bacterium]
MKASRSVSLTILLMALVLAAVAQTDVRVTPVDFVILVDRSKSMDLALEDVKVFLAGELVGPAMIAGDRVELLAFYGETETVWSGLIASEQDKAELLRSLRAISPDGAYTDIGAALDAADAIMSRLGDPERPKFVLLLSDERQEAPPGSPYASPDYVARHPRLEFSRRVDLGSFRAITIGYGLDARLDAAAESLYRLLAEPPAGLTGLLPGAPAGAVAGADEGALSVAADSGGLEAGDAAAGSEGTRSGAGVDGDGTRSSAAGGGSGSTPLVYGAVAIASLALAALAFLVVRMLRRRARDESDSEPA